MKPLDGKKYFKKQKVVSVVKGLSKVSGIPSDMVSPHLIAHCGYVYCLCKNYPPIQIVNNKGYFVSLEEAA